MTDSTQKRILCTWGLGGGFGHLSRLSQITRALQQAGHHVSAALKDVSGAARFFNHDVSLFQAPVWLTQIRMQRPIACLADTMLLNGYINPEELLPSVHAWQSIFKATQPDLVIFDYAPTALLAALEMPFKKIIVGTGFPDPVSGHPIADWRPFPAQDNLIARQEKQVLATVHGIQKTLKTQPLKQLSNLFEVDKVILNTYPDFDPYHHLRQQAIYAPGSIDSDLPAANFSDLHAKKIFAYLKPNHPQIDDLLTALKHCKADIFVACPGGQSKLFGRYASNHLRFSNSMIDMDQALQKADLFVGHGNLGTTTQSLRHGKPSVLLPIQLEQLLNANTVQKLGAGKAVVKIESHSALTQSIHDMLGNESFSLKAKEFAHQHRQFAEKTFSQWCFEACNRLLSE